MGPIVIYCICSYFICFFLSIGVFAYDPSIQDKEDMLTVILGFVFAPFTLMMLVLVLSIGIPIIVAYSIGKYINKLSKDWKEKLIRAIKEE
uniref:Uncharacterized protein n=1 Tax=viral metagenome TaxID=1070528 RepID=A0A6M3LH24_9ZZZZ